MAVLAIPAVAFGAPALDGGATSVVHGPEFGTSGGDEPYLEALVPRKGGALAAYLTSLNLTDTPPGDFIIRPLDKRGAPSATGTTYGEKHDIHVADAVLDAPGRSGVAIWDDYPDGEGGEAGPIRTQRFTAATGKPLGEPAKILTRTQLTAMERLGDGYAVLHEPAGSLDPLLQPLDAQGTPAGDPLEVDLYEPELFGASRGDRVMAVQSFGGPKVKVAIFGPSGVVLEPIRLPIKSDFLQDVVAAPKGGWLLAVSAKNGRLSVRTLSDAGKLGDPIPVKAAGTDSVGAQIAYSGRQGAMTWAGRETCDGFSGVPIGANGKPLSGKATRLSVAPACNTADTFDLQLSAAGPGRFVLGWTNSNGRAGHRIYAAGFSR